MRLDQTRIAVRERSLLEILDLSLRVVASYPLAILVGTLVAAIPLMLLNEFLCGWMIGDAEDPTAVARYLWTITLLVFIEAPLASIVVTLYLGQSLFMQTPTVRDILRSIRRSWFSLIWCQVILRGVLAGCLLVAFADRTTDFSAQEFWLIILTVFLALYRAMRPYINEIILLEQNPLRSRGDYQMTVRRRSSALHNPSAGDLFARSLMSGVVAISLVVSLLFTLWYLKGMLLFQWDLGWTMFHIGIPACMWLVVGYFTVVRFLSYLDLRIRREGWEVELMVRAAATQLTGALG